MTREILKCQNCNTYTLKESCQKCSSKTITPKPAKFSPEDKFGKYRRKYKRAYTS
ncbi:RNA-protein complex protein Nop10 [Candidatus Woesearchaeota archaeon]|nr:RNA-protein complex protein Nop10 [Candidatus Woesearchaeota archaeon]